MSFARSESDAFTIQVLNELRNAVFESKMDLPGSICLTGGRSAKALYEFVEAREFLMQHFSGFYFGDERCVEYHHPDSNYQMVINSLFPDGLSAGCSLYRMHGEVAERKAETARYANLLPVRFDLMLLSVGEDGHIASLFPGSSTLDEYSQKVVAVMDAPKPPSERLTITPKTIRDASNIIVMASGSEKGLVLAEALRQPDRTRQLPVRLTIGSTWILDQSATESFFNNAPENHTSTRIIYA